MANEVSTVVLLRDKNEKVDEFIQSHLVDGEYGKDIDGLKLYNTLFGTDFTESDPPTRQWAVEHLGSKWIHFEYIDHDQINLISAWDFPHKLIEKLTEQLLEICPEIIVLGTFEDETYDPSGGFLYAKDYDEYEEIDDIDHDLLWEDDDYREEVLDTIGALPDEMLRWYNKYLTELEEENE